MTLNETGSPGAMTGSETEQNAAGHVGTGSKTTAGARTILVVDDDRGIIRLIEAMLRLGGYVVLSADSAAGAMKTARNLSTPVDLLLTDIVMPDLSGTELVAEIREVRPGLRVIFMTGDVEGARVDTLRKPFTMQRLLEAVKTALAREA